MKKCHDVWTIIFRPPAEDPWSKRLIEHEMWDVASLHYLPNDPSLPISSPPQMWFLLTRVVIGSHLILHMHSHTLTHMLLMTSHPRVTLLMCYDWCQMMNGTEPEMHLSLSDGKHNRHMGAFYNLKMVIFL